MAQVAEGQGGSDTQSHCASRHGSAEGGRRKLRNARGWVITEQETRNSEGQREMTKHDFKNQALKALRPRRQTSRTFPRRLKQVSNALQMVLAEAWAVNLLSLIHI